MIHLRTCVICGRVYILGYRLTCSKECHERLIEILENKFGKYKKVIDAETGKAYKVPLRDIIEKGLRYEDLKNYPLWESHQRDSQENI